MKPRYFIPALIACLALGLSACGSGGSSSNSSASSGGGNTGGGGAQQPGRTFMIEPGSNATGNAVSAFVQARPGDVIEFGCGFFEINSRLLLTSTEDITIRGCGIDQTVLSFRNSTNAEGILISNVRGVRIQDMSVVDTDGNAFELRTVDHGTLQRVRAIWSSARGQADEQTITAENYQDGRLNVACTDPATQNPDVPENALGDISSPDYTVSMKSGRYGIYPVRSKNILVENAESVGASDAGIYIGQTSNAIIRNSRAAYNVFGLEIENVRHGEYANNVAECNTGGFLIYDLDNITQYGERTIMRDNISRMNNTYNFTEGGFVANVPPGSGMITLAYDRIDVFNNVFEDNNTGGIIHASYQLFPEGQDRPTDNRIDFYTEGMRIFNNTFTNNGNGLPLPTTADLQNQDVARLLPALVGLKTQAACALPGNVAVCAQAAANTAPENALAATGLRGAHIVWDGLLPEYNADCTYPVDANGDPVPMEENFPGKPRHTNEHPNPDCHYNKYKFNFDSAGNATRKTPLFFASCIDSDNTFSNDSLTYTNFNGTEGLEAALIAADMDIAGLLNPDNLTDILQSLPQLPADLDWTPHMCEQEYGENLTRIEPVVIPPFVPSGDIDPAPTEEEIAALCEVSQSQGQVNFGAAPVNCPRLDQYNLFAESDDPTSTPNGSGVPFVLNTKLFSDYSIKYRVAFLPPGTTGTFVAPGAAGPSSTLVFPVGTIIAKTFSFLENGTETAAETRLLIKRENSSGQVLWAGLPYLWETDDNGDRVANLTPAGETLQVSWNYEDVDTEVRQAGSTNSYSVPNAGECLSCHENNNLESGAAPIGLKVRNLNRPYRSESNVVTGQSRHPIAGQNQISYFCSQGILAGCPDNLVMDQDKKIITNLERLPKFNVPGDAGFAAGSDEDIEARTRAWLEVNCQHCHNPDGFAANTGYYLDVFRPVNTSYGICKGPTATGAEGSDGRAVDIQPGNADGSILEFRISPDADTPAAMMPPIARSVVDEEAHALVRNWINNVVVVDAERYPGSDSCGGNGGGFFGSR